MKTILRLLVFVKGHWKWLSLAMICLAISTGLAMIIPRMLSDGVNNALRIGDSGFLGWSTSRETAILLVAGTIVAASLLRGVSDYGQNYLGNLVSQRISYDIRNALYERWQRLSYAYHDQQQTGQLMSRATVDVEAIRMFFSMGLIGIVQVVVMVIGVSIILLVTDWKLGLLSLSVLPLIGWRAIVFSSTMRPMWMKIQEMMAKLGIILEESLTGVRVVKAFSRQKDESRKWENQAKVLYNEQIGVARQMAINVPFMAFLMAIPTALILWYGGRQVISGALTIGEVTGFIFYLRLLVMPVRRVGMMANLVSRTVSAGDRILEILDAESAVKEKTDAVELNGVKGKVSFENVSFSYNSTSPTLKNVSFTAEPGQTIALLGGSGSGKSTIANLIPRFYDVSEGRITVDDTDIRDVTIESLRANIGIAQQDIFLFSSTVKENIAYGAVDADMEEIEKVSRAAHLHEVVQNLPDGYDTWVGERGLTLSGGEKQRLSIARTLLINPSILILDDSMSSVDAETEHLIRQALDMLIKNRTTFVITHRLPIIKKANLILMLEKGEVVEQGTHDELMAKQGLYYKVFQSQLLDDEGLVEKLEEE